MRIQHLFLAVAVLAVVAASGCQNKADRQAKADAAEVHTMVQALEAAMADPSRGAFGGGTDLVSVRLLLGREEGLIEAGKDAIRPQQRMADFKSSMALREYNATLKKVLTPEQIKRLHELRVEYKYVQWVEDAS